MTSDDNRNVYLLRLLLEERFDEVFGFLRDIWERILVKIPVTALYVLQRFQVILTSKGRQTAQSVDKSTWSKLF